MPVYLATGRAYRSWAEDDPRGYVQRGVGHLPPDRERAARRAALAADEAARWSREGQEAIHTVLARFGVGRGITLHGAATCATHVHLVFSFASPACACGSARSYCLRPCAARGVAEAMLGRMKRAMGVELARAAGTAGSGRPWLSRGWDLRRVRGRGHFDHLLGTYLPEHERVQGGIFRRYS